MAHAGLGVTGRPHARRIQFTSACSWRAVLVSKRGVGKSPGRRLAPNRRYSHSQVLFLLDAISERLGRDRGRWRAVRGQPSRRGPSPAKRLRRPASTAFPARARHARRPGSRSCAGPAFSTEYFPSFWTAFGEVCFTREQWEHGNKPYQTSRKPRLLRV